MNDCDVLVVGGGPAGSACAWRLRQHGLDVLLIDRSRFPRDKVCAGWITPQVIESLAIDLDEYASTRILQPIRGFRVGVIGGDTASVDYHSTVSYGIRRCEFDEFLLRRSGVRVREGEPVRSIDRQPGGWLINQTLHARVLVGAGGHFGPVARWLRDHSRPPARAPSGECVIAAQEIEFVMSKAEQQGCLIDPHIPELYFYPDLKGYAWCFRKQHVLNIGLGRLQESQLGRHREKLLEWLVSSGRIGQAPEGRFKGHAYRLNVLPRQRCVDDRLLLVGDAAGLAAGRSGEGIRPAIESGLMAADVLAADRGDFRCASLQRYADQLDARFEAVAADHDASAGIRNYLARRLLSQRWFVRHFVLDRWFLNRRLTAYLPEMPVTGTLLSAN